MFFDFTIATKSKESFQRTIASKIYKSTQSKTNKCNTYPPAKRNVTYLTCEALNTALDPAIIFVVLSVSVQDKP